jgi:hypothetical protein
MGDEGRPPSEVHPGFVAVKGDADLMGEIAAAPPVVVTADQVNGDSGVDDSGEQPQDPGMATGYYGSPLEPEVEEVTVDYDDPCMFGCGLEPPVKCRLHGRGRGTQMGIGRYVGRSGGHVGELRPKFRSGEAGPCGRSRTLRYLDSCREGLLRSGSSMEGTMPREGMPIGSERQLNGARCLSVPFLIVLLGFAGCASTPPQAEQPPLDAGQLASSASASSALDVPYRIVFDWSLNEPGTRLRGRGVARVEPPYRARLDLFLSNGERVAAASVVGDDYRVAADGRTELPPPALLWGSLGVFRPGDLSQLRGGRWTSSGAAELRYQHLGGGELLYRLQGSAIDQMEVLRSGRTSEDLRLVRVGGERFPREATYRDLEEVRELRIILESVEHVETYPSDIWNLQS